MFVLLVMSHLEVVVFMFGLDRYLAAIGQSPFTSAEILERISLIAELAKHCTCLKVEIS